ncbi:MAG: SDR family NAD(P)-dependent oxidoreductase [Pseudomonadales bacterium]|jgi:NADP-dependent 3-hydroxy acid dehydrogenase YdfG|uniref:Ketoreductase domain-containing protein n=1 Tax=marine metagenome TaxID=408172 RepID=A0A381P5K0_9ZZZZ|nr:short-chain dehydrogenase [Gammaproteobacteria bacterium]MBN84470.1 short-chain dehydrogenase [Gammaproteobacteria bacterium]MCH2354949.1 SDR family NAD(P)-dependent oxidoreductase [Pseudomonadales bacterium]MCS5571071.1 SDR family NAD(P)-dependent oxidoreductase [Pseudomonadales bacterium]MEE3133656.1 SDR family NAD(P)-dependent oxidoreductase [Pseudomonadota bacterium]|tara:strand:+ start:5421 stop:6290 length:870 start_codon:yes stop_codon:yes gene_type:complete
MRDITGKVAFITGGASGMGLAMARSFAAAGMKVAIADVEQAALDRVKAEFDASNAEVITLRVDVTDRAAMEAAADATEAAFDKVHVLVNNAGVAVGGSLDQMSYEDWDWVMGVNLDGVVNGLQAFLQRIKAHGEGGHVVNTASLAGHFAIPGLGIYTATKYAVVGISETLRADLKQHNIGVSVLCPGVVNTNIFDSGRNRPSHLQGETDTAQMVLSEDLAEPEREQRMAEMMARALDPAVVGDMVLHSIQEDEFYIFSHPEVEPMVSGRAAEVTDAFARWRKYREDHGV